MADSIEQFADAMTGRLSRLAADIQGFLLLITAAAVLGVGWQAIFAKTFSLIYFSPRERLLAAVSEQGLPKDVPPATNEDFPEYVSLAEMEVIRARGSILIVDARPEIFYRQEHIPDAINLSRADFANAFKREKERMSEHPDSEIVVYCSSSSCQDSVLVREALQALGFRNVAILRGGWAAWKGEHQSPADPQK